MRCAYRLPLRLVRWTGLSVCLAMICSSLALIPPQSSSSAFVPEGQDGRANHGGKKVDPTPPQPGPPAVSLPNLDEARQRRPEAPRAPDPIASTVRSRHRQKAAKEKKPGEKVSGSNRNSVREERASSSEAGHRRNAHDGGQASLRSDNPAFRGHHRQDLSLAHTAETPPPPSAAIFIGTDITTRGNWKGIYGGDGYNVINDAAGYPAYAQVSASGQTPYTWAASTNDQRGLLKAASSTDRLAACWYSGTNFTIDLNLIDGNLHRVSIYSLDWDWNNARSARIDILDAGTDAVLDGRDVTSYSAGKYSTWDLQGHVKIRVTNNVAGSNAVISGLFFDSQPNNAATFVGSDTTTRGNWKGVYGTDGYNVINDTAGYPAYAQVSASGHNPYTWAASTGDQRALLKAASSSDRIAACWYSLTSFTIDVNLTDGHTHRVAVYSLDWDWNNARSERIEILDAGTNAVLDSREVTSYSGGKYSTWNLQGHVKIRVTNIVGGSNAVISGLFFDPVQDAGALALARLDPFNQSGNQLRARDCEWSLPLVSLPGRAGLDLGLSLSYSSLVWSRAGSSMYFDEDNGSPSPGFRLGWPTIQNLFFDSRAGVNARLLVTASGEKVELRQVGTSNLYQAADSSYLQLFDYGTSVWMRTTDGTQMAFAAVGDEWHCVLIKDRNGNQINANYNGQGDLSSVTDTLGRVINFNYDTYANLISITQDWNGVTHTWASFGWGDPLTMHPGFSGVSVFGTYEGEAIPVLRQVGLDDGSRYNFEYTAQGQVSVIRRYTFDNSQYIERSHTAYTYEGTDDCPRLAQQKVWAENWSNLYGVPNEVLTTFSVASDGGHQLAAPDGTVYKEFYGSGWQRGLTVQTQVLSGGLQKTTHTTWDQDPNTSADYPTNPRVIQATVDDAANNHRRTTIDYGPYAQYGLPYLVTEDSGSGTSPLRKTYTSYNLNEPYLSWHIIGLVAEVKVFDPVQSQWLAKTTFGYDDPSLIESQATTATQHDQSWTSSFLVRANVTSVSRWDVTDIDNGAKTLTTQMGYDAAGSVTLTRDPLNHVTSLHYGDWFTDGDHNTFAYPTTVTDPDGNNSSTQFNYLFGAKTRVQGPAPQGQTQGVIQTFAYDPARRLEQVTTLNNGAYVRYLYQGNAVHQYSTVNNVADEAYSAQFFDGAGHVVYAASNHPASTGGYRAVYTIYDAMGRPVKQSNPTEVTAGAAPTGDDAAGWVYTEQSYDWKGRPLLTTHLTDGTTKQASYTACGCAGGEMVTLTDEVGRQQKVYHDPLGRVAKTEIMNWDQTTVYSTTANVYDARDQIMLVRQFQGNDQSGVYQDTTMSYDGYGRVSSRHEPEQDAGSGTFFTYRPDDRILSVTDARGAAAAYSYNNRGLVTGITFSAPSGVTPTANITLSYDAAGNRNSLIDGLGNTAYSYDQLSELTSETRTFNGVGAFNLSYSYNLAGELKTITDASNSTINYSYDAIGRLNGINGSDNLVGGVATYASNFQYRAWGGLKTMTDGGSHTSLLGYNARLQPSHFEISGNVVSQNYDYYNDSRISVVHNLTDQNFDRSYSYDHTGRLVEAKSGADVNGLPYGAIPYHETFGYDSFSNLTARVSDSWNQFSDSDSAAYSNNRRPDWGYDADGRNTTVGTRTNVFDAVGQQTSMSAQSQTFNGFPYTVNQANNYDGDGAMVKEVDTQSNAPGYVNTTYYLRSAVMHGAILEELNGSGQKNVGYVYSPGGQLLAEQSNNTVSWKQNTPAGTSQFTTNSNNSVISRTEFDPVGANVSLTAPPDPIPGEGDGDIGAGHFGGIMDARWADMFNLSGGCRIDGMAASCSLAMGAVNSGAAVIGPENTTQWNSSLNKYQFFHAWADGTQGWGPLNAVPGGSSAGKPGRPALKPYNDPRHPYRPFDPDIEQPVHLSEGSDYGLGSTPAYTLDRVKSAIDYCARKLFAVALQDFKASGQHNNGSFQGYDYSGNRVPGDSGIPVVNDTSTFSAKQLLALDRKFGGSVAPGHAIIGLTIDSTDGNGKATGFSPYRNYTARDRTQFPVNGIPGVSPWVETQIWELGNSLDYIIHGQSAIQSGVEPAKPFSDCVRASLATR